MSVKILPGDFPPGANSLKCIVEVRMASYKSGTAFVNKGEPSATDAARLRRSLNETQKTELRRIMAARLRSGDSMPLPVEPAV